MNKRKFLWKYPFRFMLKKTLFRISIKFDIVILSLFFIEILLSGCCHHKKDTSIVTRNKTILKISQKLEDGSITYGDIFESDYGEYAERTGKTKDVLNKLIAKVYYHSSKNKDNNNATKVDFDKMFEENKDKIVDRILDEKNLIYFIYPSNGGERWFANDDNVRAPFNYLQQNMIFLIDKNILEDISVLLFNKLVETKKTFKLNFGTFWVLYGNGHKLEKIFGMMCDYVAMCEKKMKNGQKLTKQNYRVVSEIYSLDEFATIKPCDFAEYISKKIMIDKAGKLLKRAKNVLDNAVVEK